LSAAPTCTTAIITLEPSALDAEFQHFILIIIIFLIPYFADTSERWGQGGERRLEDRVKGRVTLQITLLFKKP
jgi:hypothetical protein